MNANQKAVDFLNEWSCKKFNGKTIKEYMTYDGFSFWWCAEFWLYYSWLYRDSLLKIVENLNNPKKEKFSIKKFIRPWGIKQFMRWHSVARKVYWGYLNLLNFEDEQPLQGRKIMSISSYNWRPVEHPAVKEGTIGDPYTTPITEYLQEYNNVFVDATMREYRGFHILKEKARSGQKHILLEQYVSIKDILTISKRAKQIRKQIKELEKTKEFQDSWIIDNINIWHLIKPQFDCYFANRLEGHMLEYWCAKTLLAYEKPDIVIYPCEGGDLAYVFFKLCKFIIKNLLSLKNVID